MALPLLLRAAFIWTESVAMQSSRPLWGPLQPAVISCAFVNPGGDSVAWSAPQGDGDVLASVAFVWDEAWMQDRLTEHLAFWSGNAPPTLVQPAEAIKCRSCIFQAQCPGGMLSTRTRIAYDSR
jgi:hypothetical protein